MESGPKPKNKTYVYNDLIVQWEPDKCIHSANCWKGLPQVFRPKERPWIQLEYQDIEKVKEQINACPSGALSYKSQNNPQTMDQQTKENRDTRVEVLLNGPLAVHNDCSIAHPNGTIEQKKNKVFFCRCGASDNKPYCDGSHKKIGFEG